MLRNSDSTLLIGNDMTFNPWRITRRMFLDEREVDRLLERISERVDEAAHDDLTAAVDDVIIRSLLFSGLRNSELCRLRVADTALGARQSVFLVRGTPREDRTVFVPQSLSDLIRRYVSRIRPQFLAEGVSPRDRSLPLIVNEQIGRAHV